MPKTKTTDKQKSSVKEESKKSKSESTEEQKKKTSKSENKSDVVSSKNKEAKKQSSKTSKSKTQSAKKEKEVKSEEKNEVEKIEKTSESQSDKLAKQEKDESTSKKSKKTSKATKQGPAPTTMEELLAQTEGHLSIPKKNQKVEGVVSDISKKMVVVDIGGKTEGVVVDREFDEAKDLIQDLQVGETIKVTVVSDENTRGQVLLSLRQAAIENKWNRFEHAFEHEENVQVRGMETNKGGMIVSAHGVRGFVPASQFGKQYLGELRQLVGKKFFVKVIEVDPEKNRLIFSERHVSEAEMIAKRDAALDAIKEGDKLEGSVCGIMPFGVFVSCEMEFERNGKQQKGQVEGLVHISEMSWEKVEDPNRRYNVGDKVKVMILGVDDASGKLNLSIKQLKQDPWDEIAKKYPVGSTVEGRVSKMVSFGVFVNFEPGVDGLIHVSKLTGMEQYKEGDKVSVSVESVEPQKRRMSLAPVLTEVPIGYR